MWTPEVADNAKTGSVKIMADREPGGEVEFEPLLRGVAVGWTAHRKNFHEHQTLRKRS